MTSAGARGRRSGRGGAAAAAGGARRAAGMELGAVLEAVEGRSGAEAVEQVLARYNEEVTGCWGGRASPLRGPRSLGAVAAPPRPALPSAVPPAPSRGGPASPVGRGSCRCPSGIASAAVLPARGAGWAPGRPARYCLPASPALPRVLSPAECAGHGGGAGVVSEGSA